MIVIKLKKFKLNPRFMHHRSEGMTVRKNKGSKYQLPKGKKEK